jgi:hypothetical protein
VLIDQPAGFELLTRFLYQQQCGVSMLRIETETDGAWMILRLIGRIRSDCINELRERVQKRTSLLILDLAEVDIVDLQFSLVSARLPGPENRIAQLRAIHFGMDSARAG